MSRSEEPSVDQFLSVHNYVPDPGEEVLGQHVYTQVCGRLLGEQSNFRPPSQTEGRHTLIICLKTGTRSLVGRESRKQEWIWVGTSAFDDAGAESRGVRVIRRPIGGGWKMDTRTRRDSAQPKRPQLDW
jgi:hypothetical protein